MAREIDLFEKEHLSGRNLRLFKEWEMIDRRCANDQEVNYIIRKRNGNGLPIVFDIIFLIKSIVGVEASDEKGLQRPIFGNKHVLRITLPNNYPSADGQPEFKFMTDVWHPNVRFFGDFKGRVCLNYADSGVYTNLINYIDRILDYLSYKDYYAVNEYPYPEDLTVAEWVLGQAEPEGWLQFEK